MISADKKARPEAGRAAPGGNVEGRALFEAGETDGALSVSLVEASDPGVGRSSANAMNGYGVGLIARGGDLTLWVEKSSSAGPSGANSRKFRVVNAAGQSVSLSDPNGAALPTGGWTRSATRSPS